MEEWLSLYGSKSGERGIFNREAAQKHVEKFGRRSATLADGRPIDFGTNPCGEIILRPKQFCNLSTMVIQPERSEEHTSELQSLMRSSYAGLWLKKNYTRHHSHPMST